jgi:clan AA aspartic protease (TIGR02281 family)
MKAVAVLLGSLALLAPVSKAQQSSSLERPQSAQWQLPSIDRPLSTSHDTVSTTRNHGHFYFATEVNGVAIPMMFDTGATWVSLRAEDAAKVGINPASLRYTVHMSTANGITEAAPVVLKELKVGGITRRNVPAIVGRPGAMVGISVLGQSFMSTMAGFSTEGDKLTLRGD